MDEVGFGGTDGGFQCVRGETIETGRAGDG